jgi:hypothetical protein
MIDRIPGGASLPSDYGANLNSPALLEQIQQFLAGNSQILSSLKIEFENKFGSSQPLVKEAFQTVLHSMIDDAVITVRSFLDSHASEHTMLPREIDHFLAQTSDFLKEGATIDMRPSNDSTVYRGSQIEEATQSKAGIIGSTGPSASSGGGMSNIMQEIEEMMHPQQKTVTQPPPSSSLSPTDVNMLSLCSDFFMATNPQDKMTIFQELTQVLQGGAPPTHIWTENEIRTDEQDKNDDLMGTLGN